MEINKTIPDKLKYLQIISTIAKPPKCLYYIGKLPAERLPSVAIIGTRKLTRYGSEVGYKFAYDLAARGVVIVSGLALGIDALAHRAALDAGGMTIAVMPCSLDQIYPASHRRLALEIIQKGGALISEYPRGSSPRSYTFIERNRIVSGLSDGMLVIEAAAKSGTMHTANFALEQGRAVMAVPGSITNPMSEGCNNLIASGARLIRNTDDILHEIGLTPGAQTALPLGRNSQETTILNLLTDGAHDGDILLQKSGLSPDVFMQTISMLEISGSIRPLGGNTWTLR